MTRPTGDRHSARTPQTRHLPAVFWGLLALTLVVRLPGIARPLLGNFATKNCVYAMIARNWAEGRAGLLYPTVDMLRGGSRSLHLLEFPCSAYLTGGLWKVFGGSLDVWGRATAVALSVASVALMFLFVRRRHGQSAATAAALALALSPVSIIYGQSFMLEASLVFLTMAAFAAAERWRATGRARWLLALGLAATSLWLTKVYMLVVFVPLAVMFCRPQRTAPGVMPGAMPTQAWACLKRWSPFPRERGHGTRYSATNAALVAVLALAVLPVALWCVHVLRTASPGGPLAGRVFYSLGEGAAAQRAAYSLLGSPDFYRQMLDDLTGVTLTPVGFVLALAGLCHRRWRRYAVWLLAMIVLPLGLPRKFHEMNYYFMAMLPPLCIMVGLGWDVVRRRIRPRPMATAVLLLAAVVLSLRYAARPAFVTPAEDRAVVAAAREARRLVPEDEPVVTMHGTSIDLLYYCNRPGWSLAPDAPDIEQVLKDCGRQGARYLVVVGQGPSPPESTLSQPAARGEGYRIYQLPSVGGDSSRRWAAKRRTYRRLESPPTER